MDEMRLNEIEVASPSVVHAAGRDFAALLAETPQFKALKQAVRIGLLPDILRERIRFIGNSSLAGARLDLLIYLEENTAALFLPHRDLSLFPSLT